MKILKGKLTEDVHLVKGTKFLIFQNEKKDKPTSPDYRITIAPPDEEKREAISEDELPF